MGKVGVVWLGLVLLTVGLSGCAGSGDGDGSGSGLKVAGSLSDNIKEGEGAIRGNVTDDIGFPLEGTKVALLGTTHIGLADSQGKFVFTNVSVGRYELFAQHPEHVEIKEPIEVRSGELLDVEIVLIPLVAKGAGYRAHIHDYWAGEAVKTVIDGTEFEYHEPYDDTGPYSETFSRTYDTVTAGNVHPCVWTDARDEVYFNNRLIWFDDPEQLVWAGTAQIEVIIDWDPEDYPYHTDFALAWASANSTKYTEGPLIQKGTSFFIDVAPGDWDSSHQGFSLWELWVCLDTASDEDVPRLFLGSFSATVKLHRMEGAIPFEKAHPVFWPESGQVPVVPGNSTTITSAYSLSRSTYNSQYVMRPAGDALVPPGTTHLTARLEWSYAGSGLETPPWSLTYRPANERFWDMKDPGDMLMGTVIDQGSDFREYEILTDPINTDQFYQKKSNWYFMLNLEGQEDDWKFINPCSCDITLTLSVTAVKASGFQEG